MTCNDCVHSGICTIQLEPHYVLDRAQKLMRESNNVEHECLSFKDKSRFVELRYKIGETVYALVHGTVKKGKVKGFFFGAGGQSLDIAVSTEPNHASIINAGFVYRTPEEAEQALKEREI